MLHFLKPLQYWVPAYKFHNFVTSQSFKRFRLNFQEKTYLSYTFDEDIEYIFIDTFGIMSKLDKVFHNENKERNARKL